MNIPTPPNANTYEALTLALPACTTITGSEIVRLIVGNVSMQGTVGAIKALIEAGSLTLAGNLNATNVNASGCATATLDISAGRDIGVGRNLSVSGSTTLGNGTAVVNDDGSASFAGGNVTFDAGGNVTFTGVASGDGSGLTDLPIPVLPPLHYTFTYGSAGSGQLSFQNAEEFPGSITLSETDADGNNLSVLFAQLFQGEVAITITSPGAGYIQLGAYNGVDNGDGTWTLTESAFLDASVSWVEFQDLFVTIAPVPVGSASCSDLSVNGPQSGGPVTNSLLTIANLNNTTPQGQFVTDPIAGTDGQGNVFGQSLVILGNVANSSVTNPGTLFFDSSNNGALTLLDLGSTLRVFNTTP